MRRTSRRVPTLLALATVACTGSALVSVAAADGFAPARGVRENLVSFFGRAFARSTGHKPGKPLTVQLGPRPYYLVDDMDEGPLKDELLSCSEDRVGPSDFSFGHRGAPLQFPEHTKESYTAAARMGAGVIECDVTFTKDRELVCRHSQCDLHTTTNILAVPELAAKCKKPFVPYDPATKTPASAECCTSDITLAEFKSLCGKMDASLPTATTPEAYLGGTAPYRTDLYATCGTLLSHKESIALIGDLGAKYTPELKEASVPLPFDGDYTQEKYAQQLVDEYKAAGVAPSKVFAQSFDLADVKYWIANEPAFGAQATYLDDRVDTPEGYAKAVAGMAELAAAGVKIVAPPAFALLALDADKRIIPSDYAVAAKQAGLDIITWSLERSGPLSTGGGYYYSSVAEVINNDGDQYNVIDALARQVGVKAIFSDWPATVTYYAACTGL
jgi:glycerophosphoryl diester phosphodiesterase